MLIRYSGQLCLMDATYKTTKYAIPLFFVCVHSNVGYKVVAEFIWQTETEEAIEEALAIIKGWNPVWNPKYFMVDYSLAEIGAIEKSFPDVQVYVCDFHRLQALKRWASASKNGLSYEQQQHFLLQMKKIANVSTKQEYDKAVKDFRESKVYECKECNKMREYVDRTWFSCAVRWAHAFRKQPVTNIVNTNNGVEAQNRVFKYEYLPQSIDKSLYGIAVMLVESLIPDVLQHYLDANLRLSSANCKYNPSIPEYLHNRPLHFLKCCLKNRYASAIYKQDDITLVNLKKGTFNVKSESNVGKKHFIDFREPSCTCNICFFFL
ncbi:LOW QUALITY PROTEIN: uncharacterized protein LOC124456977 [Xenia sp. Carnegie-2017]|uniref:LOW QUALITY PROTEIN: uncharacterized protein LOC124456977 n=1 Tax=Xenia sp. Carnegie-2017 TaxID=2897299 RepID=UPI001F0359D2|nr:LOW QUALITY PROTEIN: uncharacterized protein LOC124456977 [Xenia sp. Carnegie-2017]